MGIESGVVKATKPSKNFETKYGSKCHFSFNVNENWYTWQFADPEKPPVGKGDVVEFSYTEETNDKGYTNKLVNKKAFEKKEEGDGANRHSAGVIGNRDATRNTNMGNNPVSNDNRQDSIMRQSALGYAAQVVGNTLTSKSDLDQAANDVIRLANEYFFPYSKHGTVYSEESERKNEESNQVNHQNQQDNEDDEFGDSIPF